MTQKKTLLGLAIAGLIAGKAIAGGPDVVPVECEHCFRPFVGVNYSYLTMDRIGVSDAVLGTRWNMADDYNGINLDVGIKYGEYVAMAFGWTHYFSENSRFINANGVATNGREDRPEMYYFELRGYYNVMDTGFDLIGSVGAGIFDHATFNPAAAPTSNFNSAATSINLRLGIGADYYFTHNWGIQFLAHWSPSHDNSNAQYNYFWDLEAGLYYMFS